MRAQDSDADITLSADDARELVQSLHQKLSRNLSRRSRNSRNELRFSAKYAASRHDFPKLVTKAYSRRCQQFHSEGVYYADESHTSLAVSLTCRPGTRHIPQDRDALAGATTGSEGRTPRLPNSPTKPRPHTYEGKLPTIRLACKRLETMGTQTSNCNGPLRV